MKSKTRWLSLVIFSFSCCLLAQEAIPFKIQNEFYIYGDAVVVGNNILSKDAKAPFNDIAITNDDIDMVFVDVDENENTFSSSSASLLLPKNHKKIKYAALYWSATYSYEKGYRQESAVQFLFQGKRITKRDKISNVKLKLPNQTYKDIKGKVIFDGARDATFTLNSPYVCMADVTKLLRNTNTVNGVYTVANVIATEGFVSGGSAAGWLLYVVYEAATKKPKYITTYNGFAHVSNAPVKLRFSNFKSPEKGEVKTGLTFAALEGDSVLKEDECVFFNASTKRALLLSTNERSRNNFFNSKITYQNTNQGKRIPNSENTLGFDLISLNIPESSQPLVDNNTNEVEMVFNTESDRFYLFFTAFQTEISKTYYEKNKEEKTIAVAEVKPKKRKGIKKTHLKKEPLKTNNQSVSKKEAVENKRQLAENQKLKIKSQKEDKRIFQIKRAVEKPENKTLMSKTVYIPEAVKKEKTLPIWLKEKQTEKKEDEGSVYQPQGTHIRSIKSGLVMNRENYEKLLTKEDYVYETQKFIRVLNQEPTFIEGVNKGYYIIADIVYDFDSAVETQKELIEKGVNSKIFKDASHEKYYIYLFNSENFYDVFMLRKAFIKSPFLEAVWILNINIQKQLIKKL